MKRPRIILLSVLLLSPLPGFPHSTSTSYAFIDAPADDQVVPLRVDVSVAAVDASLGVDENRDAAITWGEVLATRPRLEEFLLSNVELSRGGERCPLEFDGLLVTQHVSQPYLSFDLRGRCPAGGRITFLSRLFVADDASQRTLLQATTRAGTFSSVLSPTSMQWVEADRPSPWNAFVTFLRQGMWHVWTGYDHVAFLLLLMLPSVLVRDSRARAREDDRPEIFRKLVLIVSSFTVAHSITLALAATGIVTVPVKPVEIAIALSIVAAAALNLWRRGISLRVPVAFTFGLVHGFGFANALTDLVGAEQRLWIVLGGFNVGVECAQLLLVVLVLPFLLRVRHSPFYSARAMPFLSLVLGTTGIAWFAERAG